MINWEVCSNENNKISIAFYPDPTTEVWHRPQQSWLGVRCGLYTIHWDPRWWKSTSLSTYTSGIHLQTQKILQNASWEPDRWKRIYRNRQHSAGQRKQGKKRGQWVELDLHLGLGTEAGTELHGRANVCDRGEALRLLESEAADQWESEWNEDHTDNPCHSCTYTRQGCKSPRKCFRLEMEHRDWVDWREMVWRNPREESTVGVAYEGKPANLEAAWYCWVTHREWSHLYSLSLHISVPDSWNNTERVAL